MKVAGVFLWCICCIFFLSLSSCGTKESEVDAMSAKKMEQKAKELLQKATVKWLSGSEVEALKLFMKLNEEYSDTKAKEAAESRLRREGISIGKALSSYTIKKLIKMENKIADSLFSSSKGVDYSLATPNDAWGKPIYFKVYPNKKQYDFIVYSSGPDRKRGTDDDLAVVHFRDKSKNMIDSRYLDAASFEDLEGSSKNKPIDTLYDEPDDYISDAEGDGDNSLSLNELANSGPDRLSSSYSEEKTATVGDLLNKEKDDTNDTGSEEMSVSVDELRNMFK